MMQSTTNKGHEARFAKPAASRARRVAATFAAWLVRELQIRRDLEIVAGLDDHLLADMGLRRDQLAQAVRNGLPEAEATAPSAARPRSNARTTGFGPGALVGPARPAI